MDNNNSNQAVKQKKASRWLEDARHRKANKKWLGYSGEIAMRILAVIENDKELSQTRLAGSLDVSKQYVNRIIQGRENLTLENIGKLSDALGFELISFPPYRYQQKDFIKADMLTTGKVVSMSIRDYKTTNSSEVASASPGNVKYVANL